MEISYRSDANHNYMIIKREKDVKICHEKMVTRNSIDGLLKMNVHYVDEQAWYYYEIQSRQSLEKLFEGRYMSYEELNGFLYGCVRVFKVLESYLLPTGSILLYPEAVFVDIDTCSPEFAYYPTVNEERTKEGFLRLGEFLTEHADREDRRCSELAYDYYMSICDGIFSPEAVLRSKPEILPKTKSPGPEKGLYEEDGECDDKPEFDYWETEEDMSELDYFLKDDDKASGDRGAFRIAVICFGLIASAAVIYLLLVLNPTLLPFPELNESEYMIAGCIIALLFGAALTAMIFVYNKKRIRESMSLEADKKEKLEKREEDPLIERELKDYRASFREESDECDDDRTTLLSDRGSMSRAVLSGRDYGKNLIFTIDRDPFILGKKKDKADGVIDDRGVSRLHASIREKNGRYFLSDLNSTNGTFVNGRRLEPNETVGLEDGDVLSFAGTYMKFSTV